MSELQSNSPLETAFFTKVLRWRYAKVLILTTFLHYGISSTFCNLFRLVMTDHIFNPFTWFSESLTVFSQPFRLIYGSIISFLPFILLTRLHITSYTMQTWIPGKRIHYVGRIFHPKVLIKSFLLTALCGYLSLYYASLAHPSFATFSIKCPDSENTCPNHPLLVVILFGFLFGIQLSVLYFTNNRSVVTFSPGSPSATLLVKLHLNLQFLMSSCSSFNFGFWTILAAPIIYILKGILFYDCMGVLMGWKATSATECLTLFSLATDVSLWLVLVLTAMLLSFIINVFFTLFREIVTQPLYLNIGVEEVFQVSGNSASIWELSSGLQSKCALLQYLSLRHLRDISTDSSLWGTGYRKQVFAISQPGGHPHNWQGILKPTLGLIKEFSVKLKVLNTPRQDSNVSSVPASGINRNLGPRALVMGNRDAKTEKNVSRLKEKALQTMSGLLEIPVIKYFVSPLPDAENRKIISQGQAVIWAVQGLSQLISASYAADEYGVVQRDIVDILTTLTQLQQVLDQSFRSSSIRVGIGASQASIDAQLRKGLRMSIRMGLYSITNTFKDGVRDLSLPDDVRAKLESYLSFQEG